MGGGVPFGQPGYILQYPKDHCLPIFFRGEGLECGVKHLD